MTYQPPAQPPAGGPPVPPPPPSGSPSGFDPKAVNALDWGILGAGFLVFIFSFIDFYSGGDVSCGGRTVSVSGSDTGSASAWHDVIGGGFFAWFAMLFAVVGAGFVAAELFAPRWKTPLPFGNRVLGFGLFGLAAIFEIIAIFVTPGDSAGGCSVSVGHGFGFWASLILILAGTVLALSRVQQTGQALPGPLGGLPNIGAKVNFGGSRGSGAVSPPAPGAYPPPATTPPASPPPASPPPAAPPAGGTTPPAGDVPPPPPAPGYGPPR